MRIRDRNNTEFNLTGLGEIEHVFDLWATFSAFCTHLDDLGPELVETGRHLTNKHPKPANQRSPKQPTGRPKRVAAENT